MTYVDLVRTADLEKAYLLLTFKKTGKRCNYIGMTEFKKI